MKIFIDNGHGRNTAGKRSPDGQFLEYYYNRIVARRVTAKLQALGLDAELLVPEEDDISLVITTLSLSKPTRPKSLYRALWRVSW